MYKCVLLLIGTHVSDVAHGPLVLFATSSSYYLKEKWKIINLHDNVYVFSSTHSSSIPISSSKKTSSSISLISIIYAFTKSTGRSFFSLCAYSIIFYWRVLFLAFPWLNYNSVQFWHISYGEMSTWIHKCFFLACPNIYIL